MSLAATNVIATVMRLSADSFVAGAKQANRALDGLIRGNLNAQSAAGALRQSLLGVGGAAGLAAAAAVGAGLAIAAVVNKAAALGQELFTLSQRTGETVENLSRLKFAADQEDVSMGQVASGLRIASQRAVEASRGNKEAAESFRRLGVDVRDANGNIKSGTELLRDIGAGLATIPAGAERTAAAVEVLGRSGTALIPLLTNLDALFREADEFGFVISAEFAASADEFGDNIGRLKTLSAGFGVAIAEEVLPPLNDFLEDLIDAGKTALPEFRKNLESTLFVLSKVASATTIAGTAAEFVLNPALFVARKRFGDARDTIGEAIKQLKLSKEEWLAQKDAIAETNEELEKTKPVVLSAAEQLRLLGEQFEEATNPQVTAIVGLTQSLKEMGTEGAAAFDKLIAKLNQLAAAGNAQAQLALDRIEAINDATLRAIAAEGDALRREAEFAQAEGRPFGIAGGQIGPREAPRPGEEGFIGPQTREEAERATGQIIPATIEETLPLLEKARLAQAQIADEAERSNTAYEQGQALIAGISNVAVGFADAIVSAAEGGKLAFQDFFKGLLRSLLQAIVRATILVALLSAVGIGGGFSLARIGKNVQAILGLGGAGFQDQESSMLGRSAQARSLQLGGTSLAGASGLPTPNVTVTPRVVVNQATPATWVQITDEQIMPRLRTRQRRLNDDLR